MALCCLALALAPPAGAQWAVGPWEDATIVPRGALRIGIPARWSRANQRFQRNGTDVESLGADFTHASLDESVLTTLSGLKSQLQVLTGLTAPTVSLGRLAVGIEATSWSVPLALDLGLTSRISLTALVPYVKTRAEVFVNTNSSVVGTLGPNPAFIVPAARTRNAQVVTELNAARTSLQTQLTACANSSAPSCSAINANRAGATALVASAAQTASALADIYGTESVAGSAFVPLGTGSLQTAVLARLTAINADFTTLLGAATSGEWIASRPVAAPPLGYTDLQRFLTDSSFGIGAVPLADIEHSHLGDVEIGAKMVLLNTFGPPAPGAPPRGAGARLAVAGVYRLGTGQRESPDNFADMGTGDGQNDVELRGYLDLLAGRRWWVSVVGRYGIQMADRLPMRVPAFVGEPFPPLFSKIEVERDLGDYFDLEVSPRFAPNASFAFSGNYRMRSKGADRYTGNVDPDLLGGTPPRTSTTLGMFTEQDEQRVGFALTYSTLRGYALRRSPWPLEMSLMHTQVLSGKGGVPKEFVTAVTLRLYHSLFGGDPMRGLRR